MVINYKVSPTFARFHACKTRYKFVMGPVGSGKSSGCMWDLFFNAAEQTPDENGVRHSRYAVIRATYPQLKSSTVKTFIEWFKDKITVTYGTPITARLNMDLDDGTKVNTEFMFVAVGDEVDAEKLRSWEFTGAWVNEAHEIPEYLLNTILPARTSRYPARRSTSGPVNPMIIVDYNAVPTDHWLYTWAEETKPENCTFFKQPPAVLRDAKGNYTINPEAENFENLPTGYYENFVQISSKEAIQTDLMNLYGERKAGKAVYKDYNDDDHAAPLPISPPEGMHVIIGLDQGLTPAAAFTFQDMDGKLVCFDEIVTEDCSLQEFAQERLWPLINTKYPWIKNNFSCVIDPAAQQRSMNDAKAGMEILKEAGLPIRLAKSNSPTDRREAVTYFLLRKDKFRLSPECKMLRRGFISEYKYEERRAVSGAQFKEKPMKNIYSHVHDALQYAAMEYEGVKKRRAGFFSSNRLLHGSNQNTYIPASQVGGY